MIVEPACSVRESEAVKALQAEIELLRGLLREVFGESRLTDQLNWPGDLRERVREALDNE